MFPKFLIVLLLAALAVGLVARSSNGAGPERSYVVKPADTLWSIAARSYARRRPRGRLEAPAAEPSRLGDDPPGPAARPALGARRRTSGIGIPKV